MKHCRSCLIYYLLYVGGLGLELIEDVCYEKLLRDSIIRVYANLVQKLREYLISLCHDD